MAKRRAGRGTRPPFVDRFSLIGLAWLATCWGLLVGGAGASTSISTVAGGGTLASDGVPALEAALSFPSGVRAAANGFVVAEQSKHRIRRVTVTGSPAPDLGMLTTFAGTGSFGGGTAVLGGAPTAVPLQLPCCISPTAAGGMLVADTFGGMVHQVAGARLDTVAGSGTPSSCPSTPPVAGSALNAQLCFVVGVGAHPADGRFLVAEDGLPDQERSGGARVYEVDSAGLIRIVAGGGCPSPPVTPGPLQVCLANPRAPTYTGSGSDFIVADRGRNVVWKIASTTSGATATRIAGTGTATAPDLADLGDGGAAGSATLAGPSDLALVPGGGYLIADRNNCRIRRVAGLTAASAISTAAGTTCSEDAPAGDGGPATAAGLRHPQGVGFSPAGVLISDTGRGTVRLVDRTSITGGTSGTVSSPSAAFEFQGSEPSPEFRCALDGQQVPSPCTSPKSYTGLADGRHTFRVHDSVVPADPTPAVRTWTVDTKPPTAFELIAPADGAMDLPPQPSFEWQPAGDATSGVARYEIWVDGARVQEVDPASCASVCRAEAALPLAEAFHTWEVRAVDGADLVRSTAARRVYVGSPPVARLTIAPNPVLVDGTVVLDGSASSDAGGPIARYEWDLDGDGRFELDTGPRAVTHMTYPVAGTMLVTLRVTDGVGRSDLASRNLRVSEPPGAAENYGVTINAGASFTGDAGVRLRAVYPPGTTSLLVSNDGGFLAAAPFAPARETPWRLGSTGPERLPKTVYVRFRSGPFVSETYTDDIVLDETAPVVSAARLGRPSASGGASVGASVSGTKRRYLLRVKASDDASGVGWMQMTSNRRKPGKARRFKRRQVVMSAAPRLWVRVVDRAGNRSRWRTTRYFGPR